MIQLLANPLATILGAVALATSLYAGVLKIDNVRLSSANKTLAQAEAIRIEQARLAIERNKKQAAKDKISTQQLEAENAKAKQKLSTAYDDNRRLLDDINRLRNASPNGCPVPTASANSKTDIRGSAAVVFGQGEQLLIEIARDADKVRENLITCQKYVRRLHDER